MRAVVHAVRSFGRELRSGEVVVLLAIAVANTLPHEAVVYGQSFVNSFTFVIGWLVGEWWLRHRLGPLGSSRFLKTLGKSLIASIVGGLAAWGVSYGIDGLISGPAGAGTGWLQLILGSLAGFGVIFGVMSILRVAELQPAIGRVTGLLRRR